MSLVDNSVFDEPFTSVELTNAINRRPHTPDGLGALFDWQVTRSLTTGVRINMSNGQVVVAPYVPRDGVPPVIHGPKRSALTVEIPGIAGRASAYNREALNATAGLSGEQRLLALETLRDEKMGEIDRAIDEGEKRQVADAIRGQLTSPDDNRVVCDLLALQGLEQIEADVDLTDSKITLNEQIEAIKEISEQAIGSAAEITGFKWILGKNDSIAIRGSQEYKEILTNPLANYLAKADGRKSVPINDNVEVVHNRYGYMGVDESYLVPVYAGHAQIVYGPHESDDFWGNVLPRYVTSQPMPHRKGIEMEGWAFVLRYFQHPEAIIKTKILGA